MLSSVNRVTQALVGGFWVAIKSKGYTILKVPRDYHDYRDRL